MSMDVRIAELRAIVAATDPAPWEPAAEGSHFLMAPDDEMGTYVASVRPRTWSSDPTSAAIELALANVTFIAAARTAVPELLDEIDRLNLRLRDERELHRDTRIENTRLRRRLVEAGALDPDEEGAL